jgi:drug/metabolite transporter (DMT)-like permease
VPLLGTILAYLIWAICPIAICSLSGLPLLEMAFFTLGSGGLVAMVGSLCRRKRVPLGQRMRASLVPALLIFGEQLCYFSAFRFVPPHHVDFLNYLWPIFGLMGAAFFFKQLLRPTQVVGVIGCLGGIVLLIGPALGPDGFSLFHLGGYLLAIGGAMCGASYALWMQRPSGGGVGFQFVLAALAVGLLHLGGVGAEWVTPASSDVAWFCFLGITNYAIAYPIWTWSLRNGHFIVLSMLSYPTALISSILMIAVGLIDLTPSLVIATILIMGGYGLAQGIASKLKLGKSRKRVPLPPSEITVDEPALTCDAEGVQPAAV